MDKVSIVDHIRKNSNILSLPQVLSEVLQEVGKENFSADSLARIILKDPSLTSRVLMMANSTFYHRYSDIKTVHQAISIMGVTTVKCLALSSSIFHPDKIAKDSGVDPKEFFSYILSAAAACKRIANETSYVSSEEAFIAGLLHDVGLLFFLHHYPKEYHHIISKKDKEESLIEAELKVFGIGHDEVGYQLAAVWRLPEAIGVAIGSHYEGPRAGEENKLGNIVKLGVLLTKDRFSGYELGLEDRLARISELAESLQLTKNQVDQISSSLLTDTFEIAAHLGLDIGNIEEMLTKANQEIWRTYLLIENLFKERQELSRNLLEEERAKGAMESKTIALATLSHYLNNAVMAIYGRSQIMNLMLRKGQNDKVIEQLPDSLKKIDQSVKKIVAVLEEMKEVSPIDQKKFNNMSKAMNIDDRIEKRLSRMTNDAKWEELLSQLP